MKRYQEYLVVASIVGGLSIVIYVTETDAQYTQPVGPSAAWCKQDIIDSYDPRQIDRYTRLERTGGTKENPIKCHEILDKENNRCMVKFDCGGT